MNKKIIVMVALTLALSAGILTGCGKKAAKENSSSKISIMMADAGRANKTDNPIIAEINKKLNIDIDLQLIPTAEFKNKVNVCAAGGTLPDMVRFSAYDYFQYVNQKLFLKLDDYIDKYNNIKSTPKDSWAMSKCGDETYAIPLPNPDRGKNNTIVRKDWLDKLGLAMPENLNDLRNMYNKFTYGDPDGNGKNDTYGMSTTGEIISGYPESFMGIFGAFGIQPGYYHLDGDEVICDEITEQYKKSLEYLYQLYSVDKVIDPDIFIVKTDQSRQSFVQGKYGSFTGMWSIGPQVCVQRMKMYELNPNAEIAVMPAIKGENGECGYRSKTGLAATICLSNDTKSPEKCLELIDYLLSEEGTILANYGFEGDYYTTEDLTVDGKPMKNYIRTQKGQEAMDNKWIDSMAMFCSRTPDNMVNQYYNDEVLYSHIKAAAETPLYYDLFEGLSTDELVKYADSLGKFELDSMINFITGKTPISEFDNYVNQWKQKGGEEVSNSLVNEYNKRHNTNYKLKLD